MATLKTLLYQRVEGANEDWWRLVLDADAKSLTVEHEWKHGNAGGPGYHAGTDELDINTFLQGHDERGAQDELIRLLGQVFRQGVKA